MTRPAVFIHDSSNHIPPTLNHPKRRGVIAGKSKAVSAPPHRPRTEFERICFKIEKYLLIDDREVIPAVFGAAAAHRLGGIPAWLFLVGPPSGSKTSLLELLGEADGIYPLSDLTPNTFASGFLPERAQKPETNGPVLAKSYSLLDQFSEKTIVTLKDFTSVLSMHDDKQRAILAQLREIFDGSYEKAYGNGQRLSWKGRIGLLAGVTPIIDKKHRVSGLLGPRFMLIRVCQPDRHRQAMIALNNNDDGDAAKRSIMADIKQFLNNLPAKAPATPDAMRSNLAHLADLTTMARSPVERDRKSDEVDYAPEPEMPARFARQLDSLLGGVALVREHHTAEQEDFDVVVRVGLDTIPEVRRAALLSLVQIGGAGSLPEIRDGIGRSQSESTTRRALEELVVLGVLSEKKTARQTEYQIVSPAHLNILSNFLRAFLGDGEVGTSDATR